MNSRQITKLMHNIDLLLGTVILNYIIKDRTVTNTSETNKVHSTASVEAPPGDDEIVGTGVVLVPLTVALLVAVVDTLIVPLAPIFVVLLGNVLKVEDEEDDDGDEDGDLGVPKYQ